MLTLNLKVHEQRIARDGTVKEVKTMPYLRLATVDHPGVFLQEGIFFAEEVGQIEVDDLPEWVIGELAKCSDEVLKECRCPEDMMNEVKMARASYQAQQKADLEARRRKLYGNR